MPAAHLIPLRHQTSAQIHEPIASAEDDCLMLTETQPGIAAKNNIIRYGNTSKILATNSGTDLTDPSDLYFKCERKNCNKTKKEDQNKNNQLFKGNIIAIKTEALFI